MTKKEKGKKTPIFKQNEEFSTESRSKAKPRKKKGQKYLT